ncbi:MAG: ASKHA domain-containing protein [Opitutaceae bacterium]|nr:ASKHA domain-containing protein [Opitutaceae bacterium]
MNTGTPVTLESSSAQTLFDAITGAGYPLDPRCGRRGLCRGCAVELEEGRVAEKGQEIGAPASVRACCVDLVPGVEVVVRVPERLAVRPPMKVENGFECLVGFSVAPTVPPTPGRPFGLAVDVGTTTVAMALVDLNSGEILERAGDANAQQSFGDNVLSRIVHAGTPNGLRELQNVLVRKTLLPLISEVCARAEVSAHQIAGATFAGNTTLMHLLAGEDPTGLGTAPFTARFLETKRLCGADIGLDFAGAEGSLVCDAKVILLPSFSAYVGADLTGGLYATGMSLTKQTELLVDIGTNGEVVLSHEGRLYATATAAGPAFEGGGLSSGMRACKGTVARLALDADGKIVTSEIIGDVLPSRCLGMCGSAYVDFLALGRSAGALTATGRFDEGAWRRLADPARGNAVGPRAYCFGGYASITEQDVAHLLQAKAALAAGIDTVLACAGVDACEVATVYLAGGFGMHLVPEHAIQMGLLPGFRPQQIRVVGNTSLAGAMLALIDRPALAEMERLARTATIIDLNRQDGFEDRFLDHLCLP